MDRTRGMDDHELEAVVEEQLASREQPDFVRGCSVTAGHCATMLFAYVNEYLGGYAYREHAAGLRELADSMIRLGVR